MAKFLVTRTDNTTVEVTAYGIQNTAGYSVAGSTQLVFFDYVRPFRFNVDEADQAPAPLAQAGPLPYDEFGDFYDDFAPAPARVRDYPTIWISSVFNIGEWKSVLKIVEEE